ncbi:MAG: DUF58 domain-containing protein [Thermoplasmata archaeon]|nr:DUF58 domain-containing protein [Thermoplasmata archaeon]
MARVVLTTVGGALLAAGLGTLLLAFYALSLILFVFATFLLAFVGGEVLTFAYVIRGFGPESFDARRVECSSFVPVRGAAFVGVRIAPRIATGFYAEVFDSHPDRLETVGGSSRLLTWWAPGSVKTLAYITTPSVRGRFELGPTVVVAHDTFGFAFCAAALPTPWTLESIPRYPSVRIRRAERFSTPVFGQSPDPARGAGMDFHSLREYATTDDPRRIAWTHSGKGTLYVREFQRESQEEVLVLLDVGRAMAAGPVVADALEKAVDAAGLAAQYSFDEDIRFGLVLFSDRIVSHLPPGRGPDHEFAVARALAGVAVDSHSSSLTAALEYLSPRLKTPAHLLAFSTAQGEAEELARVWGALRRSGHRLNLFVPDLRTIYPGLPSATSQRAFDLLLGPEIVRVDRQAEVLRRLGVPVARYGPGGAAADVGLIFAPVRGRRVAA